MEKSQEHHPMCGCWLLTDSVFRTFNSRRALTWGKGQTTDRRQLAKEQWSNENRREGAKILTQEQAL